MNHRSLGFIALVALSVLAFREDLADIALLARSDPRYTHVLAIPFLSLGLTWLRRIETGHLVRYGPRAGLAVGAAGIAIYFAQALAPTGWNNPIGSAAGALGIITVWAGIVIGFFGLEFAVANRFSLGLLGLAAPLPIPVVERVEVFLQFNSAEVTEWIFLLSSTNFLRDGLLFSLPGLTIEVSRECSGIRSTTSSIVTALVLGHMFLRGGRAKAALVLLAIPIGIFRNAFRIATLAWLGAFVSEDYLHGDLHHRGGPVFFVLSLTLILGALWVLRRVENRRSSASPGPPIGRSVASSELGTGT